MGFGHKIKRRSRKSVFNKGREESFPSLHPIQVEISMLGTDPNIPVEIKYLMGCRHVLIYDATTKKGE